MDLKVIFNEDGIKSRAHLWDVVFDVEEIKENRFGSTINLISKNEANEGDNIYNVHEIERIELIFRKI